MRPERPWAISVVCIVGVLGTAAILLVDRHSLRSPEWERAWTMVTAVIVGVSMVGLWLMKKWGVIVFAVWAVAQQCVHLAMGCWTIYDIAIPGIMTAVALRHCSEME